MFRDYPDVIRPQQLCTMLGIGRTKVYGLLKTGTIPHRKIGGNYFIRKIDVIEFLKATE